MKRLDVAVQKGYFDSIRSGAKVVEYREMSDYWINRLVDTDKYPHNTIEDLRDMLVEGRKLKMRSYDEVVFHCSDKELVTRYIGVDTYKGHTTFAINIQLKR